MESDKTRNLTGILLDKKFIIFPFILIALIMQDISLMGIVRRIMQDTSIPNLPFLTGGLFLFFLPYARISQYEFIRPYSLKALPCVITWFTIVYRMLVVDFKNYRNYVTW